MAGEFFSLLGFGWLEGSLVRLTIALGVTIIFAGLAWAIRGVTSSGAAAGIVVCLLLFANIGPGGFAALVSVFILAWITTRMGYARKQRIGTAEQSNGRTAAQVFANLGIASVCALLSSFFLPTAFLLACGAALAEAAADTVSSEFGQVRSDRAWLVTTLREVPAGTDGGVTLDGTAAGVLAALIVSTVCMWVGLIPREMLWIMAIAGVLGMLADSYLGAWFERRGRLDNNTVNFLSTSIAAVIALVLWRLTFVQS